MTSQTFNTGDRVQERYGWLDPVHGLVKRLGEIVDVYEGTANGLGQRRRFYAVRWDGAAVDTVDRDYLGAGLVKVFVLPPVLLAGVRS